MSRTSISQDDPDFDQFWVRIHGSPIANVLSADALKGEVRAHDGAHELKTGTVTITPKSPEQLAPPASAGRTSRSRRSTSGE